MRDEFNSKPFYGDKCKKTNVKSFHGMVHTNFHDNEVPKKACTVFIYR